MRNYYYLAISLPELDLNARPLISFQQLMDEMRMNLAASDLKQIEQLQLYNDLVTLENSLMGEPPDSRSSLTALELKEAIKLQEHFSDDVFEFFQRFPEISDQVKNFPILYSTYFSKSLWAHPKIAQMVMHERQFRLFVLGYRTIRYQRSVDHEFRFEDLTDQDVEMILSDNPAATLLDEVRLRRLKEQLDHAQSAIEVRRYLAAFRLAYYQEILNFHPFDLIGLIAYMMQLSVIEDLQVNNPQKGLEIFQYILKEEHEHSNPSN
jgi:hypothetical protein